VKFSRGTAVVHVGVISMTEDGAMRAWLERMLSSYGEHIMRHGYVDALGAPTMVPEAYLPADHPRSPVVSADDEGEASAPSRPARLPRAG
jgi:hypothetical protein